MRLASSSSGTVRADDFDMDRLTKWEEQLNSPVLYKDYILILPEPITDTAQTNELLSLPKSEESELNFKQFGLHAAYRAANLTINQYEEYIREFPEDASPRSLSCDEFLKQIDLISCPMDSALMTIRNYLSVSRPDFADPQFAMLFARYRHAKDSLYRGKSKIYIKKLIDSCWLTMTADQQNVLRTMCIQNPDLRPLKPDGHDARLKASQVILSRDCSNFCINADNTASKFSYLIDDPDVLESLKFMADHVMPDSSHNKRSPFYVTQHTYNQFLQLCPDRSLRNMVWRAWHKRNAPENHPKKLTNLKFIHFIRQKRKDFAFEAGYRNWLEMQLRNSLAGTKDRVLASLKAVADVHSRPAIKLLADLNEYATEKSITTAEDMAIQEYDLPYWINRYKHEEIYGKSTQEVEKLFTVESVLQGLSKFATNYLGIELNVNATPHISRGSYMLELRRNGETQGRILLDTYVTGSKNPIASIMRSYSPEYKCIPLVGQSIGVRAPKGDKDKSYLNPDEVVQMFLQISCVFQYTLYRYNLYSLNRIDALEPEMSKFLGFYCLNHLLHDHRIIQDCCVDKSKLDQALANKLLDGVTRFYPLQMWYELFKAHMDIELHNSTLDVMRLLPEIYALYSPFNRAPDDYDICGWKDVFGGTGVHSYTQVWAKQLANFCFTEMNPEALANGSISDMDPKLLRERNSKLIDAFYNPQCYDTNKNMESLLGRRFELSDIRLGMI